MGQALLNLNNALNALADLRCAGNWRSGHAAMFADQMAEAWRQFGRGHQAGLATPIPVD